jgi:hypothetical protein
LGYFPGMQEVFPDNVGDNNEIGGSLIVLGFVGHISSCRYCLPDCNHGQCRTVRGRRPFNLECTM